MFNVLLSADTDSSALCPHLYYQLHIQDEFVINSIFIDPWIIFFSFYFVNNMQITDTHTGICMHVSFQYLPL